MDIDELVPHQWKKTIIQSVHKKGPKEDLSNQRGIFLRNTVSKMYDRVKLIQNDGNIKRSDI